MRSTDAFVVCFEMKENFDYNSIINWLNKIQNLKRTEEKEEKEDKDKKRIKDVFLVLCKYDEFIFNKKQKGELNNTTLNFSEEILELINIKVYFLFQLK